MLGERFYTEQELESLEATHGVIYQFRETTSQFGPNETTTAGPKECKLCGIHLCNHIAG